LNVKSGYKQLNLNAKLVIEEQQQNNLSKTLIGNTVFKFYLTLIEAKSKTKSPPILTFSSISLFIGIGT